jgi:hypothetical protein
LRNDPSRSPATAPRWRWSRNSGAALESAAAARALTLPALVAEIDAARAKDRLLASACRIYALAWARGER